MGKSRIERVFSVMAAIGRRQPAGVQRPAESWPTTRRFEGEAKNGSRNNDEKIDR
ncbi:hypothetical protein [Rhizobium sp. R339]|uniref:hypothetical protein n=1 Tax=Rhizobium sp. R339 TaxID=1764273 RepID=UPI00167D5555|nr:hypothetical protein [Rhizobium sp. R339]